MMVSYSVKKKVGKRNVKFRRSGTLSQTMPYTPRKTVFRLARRQLHLNQAKL